MLKTIVVIFTLAGLASILLSVLWIEQEFFDLFLLFFSISMVEGIAIVICDKERQWNEIKHFILLFVLLILQSIIFTMV